ncbi:MAG: helix-turn-helix domain-containing protein [Dermatophilaceae bacterium]
MARVRTASTGRTRALAPEGSPSSQDDPNSNAPAISEVSGSNDTRERILDAAEDLFAADGFDATPTSRIARRAAVAKGLLFYYFPRKTDLLRTLFTERLPAQPLSSVVGIAVSGDLAGSLLRLADRIGLTRHHSQVLSEILFREASTHPYVRDHIDALHKALMDVTETVLDAASPRQLDRMRRRAAAGTFVAVLMHEANFHRFDGPLPDLGATAEIVSSGLLA